MKKLSGGSFVEKRYIAYQEIRQHGNFRAAVGSGATSATYEYNEDGIRISKTAGGAKHTYYLNGTQIVAEEWSNKLLIYLYDESDFPIGMHFLCTGEQAERKLCLLLACTYILALY